MSKLTQSKDQRLAAWIFGSISFAVLVYFVLFGPKELPADKRQAFGILCSLLCGFFGFFLTGSVKLVTESNIGKWGKVTLQAGGGMALFVFVMLWWNSGAGPVREIKKDVQKIKEMIEKLAAAQKRDAPGSELLAEFRQRLGAKAFSAVKAEPDERVLAVLAELALFHGITVDELRQKMLQAAARADERIELAGQLRRASESEVARMKQIERDGYEDLASAAMAAGKYSKALEYLAQALGLTSPDEESLTWARLQVLLGQSHMFLGNSKTADNSHFEDAIAAFRKAQTGMHEGSPEAWAAVQNALGYVIYMQAQRSKGKKGIELFGDASAAYRESLKVLTQEESPDMWAMAQHFLGDALHDQAKLSDTAPAIELDAQAVAAYEEALKVYTPEAFSRNWAAVKAGLAEALSGLAKLSDTAQATELYAHAVAANQGALKVYTQADFPQEWAAVKAGLAEALSGLAKQLSDTAEATELYAHAVAANQEALKVYTQADFPQQWAAVKDGLAHALRALAVRSEGMEAIQFFGKAIAAHREALKVATHDRFPEQWAAIQNNLGNILRERSALSDGDEAIQLLDQAVTGSRKALEVFTREQFPQDWARTQLTLGNALRDQAKQHEGAKAKELHKNAVKAFQGALEVFTRERFPKPWAETQFHLGNAMQEQAERPGEAQAGQLLSEAVAAYRKGLTVYTQEAFPRDWAKTQNSIGSALLAQSERSEKAQTAQLLNEAAAAFRNALTVFTVEHFEAHHNGVAQNLALTEEEIRKLKP